jgi:hypothetical protein
LLTAGAAVGGTKSNSGGASAGRSTEQGWNEQRSGSRSSSHGTSAGGSNSDIESTAVSYQHSEARGGSHSKTVGWARTTGEADSSGTSEAQTTGQSQSKGNAQSTSKGAGLNLSFGVSQTVGRAEALGPVLKELPGGVHSLENLKHKGAEMLCTLPDGVAVVRTVRDGRIEGAVVRIPYRRCAPVSDDQYAADLDALMAYGGVGKPMHEAMRHIDDRERRILSEAQTLRLPPPEPESFRVAASKSKRGGSFGRVALVGRSKAKALPDNGGTND